MKILVTGGAGFIASNVVDAYMEAGHEVVVMDNLFTGKKENVNPGAKFYQLDIRSDEARRVCERERPEILNHHAAQISVPASVEDPVFDADVNIKGFLNLLEAARRSGTRKVVFISSGGAIYGEAEEYPTTERCQPKPLSPYAITKSVSEKYLEFYNNFHSLGYTVLRYSNVYGPRQVPHGEAGVVAIFMDRLLSGKPCVINQFSDTPGGMTRDYCYVGDVVRANLLALERGDREAFNIGTGVATRTADLFNLIFNAVKERAPKTFPSLGAPEAMEARQGDLRRSCLDAGKARSVLGWTPLVGLAEGIRKTLEWRMARSALKS